MRNVFSIITDDNCQYWKNLEDMTLSSPNYPLWYNADGAGCQWLISAPEGFIVALEFNHFHVITYFQIWPNILQYINANTTADFNLIVF